MKRVVRSSGVRGEWWQEGGERGSSTSVKNTEYEKHVQLQSTYDFAGLKYSDHSEILLTYKLLLHKLSQISQLQ